jgi:hypothetical protein
VNRLAGHQLRPEFAELRYEVPRAESDTAT